MAHVFRAAVVAALLVLGAMMLRAADVPIRFTDVAAGAGLVLPKVPVSAAKDFLLDTTGNGVALFDYDADGDLDVLVVTGSTFERLPTGGDRMVALFRNDGGRFTDVHRERPHAARMGDGCVRGRLRQRRLRGHLRHRVHR